MNPVAKVRRCRLNFIAKGKWLPQHLGFRLLFSGSYNLPLETLNDGAKPLIEMELGICKYLIRSGAVYISNDSGFVIDIACFV